MSQLRTQLHRHGRSTSFRSGPPRTASSSSARARVPADDAAAAAAATILPPSDDADGPGLPNGSGTATADLTASNNDNEATPLLRSIYRNTAGGADGHANGSGAAGDRPWYSAAAAGAAHATRKTLASSWANVLLVFVPIGIAAGAAGWSAPAIFAINFVAIMPLAALLSFATEELATRLGETLGGLLNATFGNAVELIVSILALRRHEIRIVQASMLGSILSNILLVLGCCFISGGLQAREQSFNTTVASTMSSLMAVACASLIIPATLYAALEKSSRGAADVDANILLLSRGTAVILLVLYLLYLWFQLRSHSDLFDAEGDGEAADGAAAGAGGADAQQQQQPDSQPDDGGQADEEPPLTPLAASVALVVVTVLVSVCAEYLVASIDTLVQTIPLTRTFIGLILLPIVGNAAEHVTAVLVAYKGRMSLAINVALGSSMQIALFVTPFLVMLGWILGVDMTLRFQGFETVVFALSVLVVNYLIIDGKSNYLEGCMCLGTYIIIALAFFVYPDNAESGLDPGFFRAG